MEYTSSATQDTAETRWSPSWLWDLWEPYSPAVAQDHRRKLHCILLDWEKYNNSKLKERSFLNAYGILSTIINSKIGSGTALNHGSHVYWEGNNTENCTLEVGNRKKKTFWYWSFWSLGFWLLHETAPRLGCRSDSSSHLSQDQSQNKEEGKSRWCSIPQSLYSFIKCNCHLTYFVFWLFPEELKMNDHKCLKCGVSMSEETTGIHKNFEIKVLSHMLSASLSCRHTTDGNFWPLSFNFETPLWSRDFFSKGGLVIVSIAFGLAPLSLDYTLLYTGKIVRNMDMITLFRLICPAVLLRFVPFTFPMLKFLAKCFRYDAAIWSWGRSGRVLKHRILQHLSYLLTPMSWVDCVIICDPLFF